LTRILLLAVLVAAPVASPRPAPDAPPPRLAVIANHGVPADDVSLSELRKLFRGDRQFWSDEMRVVLLIPPPASSARAALLDKVYEKTETQYRHYWISKVFRAEAQSAPKTAESAVIGDLVRQIPGAITVVDAGEVPTGVKLLRVDGREPADADYPLR
jgi:hypothetical protein